MSRNPPDGIGVIIVDLATENFFTPRTVLGGGDDLFSRLKSSSSQLRQVNEGRTREAQRPEYPILAEAV